MDGEGLMFRLDERGSLGSLLVTVLLVVLVAVFVPTAFDAAISRVRQCAYGVIEVSVKYNPPWHRARV